MIAKWPWFGAFLAVAGVLAAAPVRIFVEGTGIPSGIRGIYASDFDTMEGTLANPILVASVASPSFLAIAPSQHELYTADAAIRTMSAFRIEPASGRLNLLNRQPIEDASNFSIAHLRTDATGRTLIGAAFPDGRVHVFPIAADGKLGPETARVSPRGPPGPAKRQDRSHPHGIALAPDGRFAAVCDLGLDRVFIYRLDPKRAKLGPDPVSAGSVPPGAGPRHGAFSADGHFLYVVAEMGNLVCVFAFDRKDGALSLRQTISSLPPDSPGSAGAAEIEIHPNGRFLYVSNRGSTSNNLAVFARDIVSGTIRLIQAVPCGGDFPRSFAISPDGRWLLCANQKSGNIVVFRLEPSSGRLSSTGRQVPIGHPECVLFCRENGSR